jgi:hypothetical protein
LLVQAKGACDKGGFTAFRERFCPKLGKTRAHELLQIASGKKTIEDVRAATARRMKKHRAAKKTTVQQQPKPSVTVTDPDPAVIAEKQQAAVEQKPKPSVTVTDQDPAGLPRRSARPNIPTRRRPTTVPSPSRRPSRRPSLRSPSGRPNQRSRKPRPK